MIRPKAQPKVEEKGRTDKECFRCGRIGHIRADCRAKTHLDGGPPKSAPKGKSAGNCEDERQETSQHLPLETIDLGSFEVLSNHGDTVEDDVVFTNPQRMTNAVSGMRVMIVQS